MTILHLTDRNVVCLSGADAESLLQRLITTDLDDVAQGEAGYGALLSPQGKILMDFLVVRQADAFWFDLDSELVADFVKKMSLYRLRSDVTIEKLKDKVGVCMDADHVGIRDPRSEALSKRVYGAGKGWNEAPDLINDYTSQFIDAVVPQIGKDFEAGDAFPHDLNMDFLGGLDFEKGCYVGQEVVSRMQHRGTARKRLVRIVASTPLPQSGTNITAGGKTIGTLGVVADKRALAQVRLDRLAEAKQAGDAIMIDQAEVSVQLPDYGQFTANA